MSTTPPMTPAAETKRLYASRLDLKKRSLTWA